MLCIFNATTTTQFYTLSLHDALPILIETLMKRLDVPESPSRKATAWLTEKVTELKLGWDDSGDGLLRLLKAFEALSLGRSEEHTSELQSHSDLVCRLLLEKKKELRLT